MPRAVRAAPSPPRARADRKLSLTSVNVAFLTFVLIGCNDGATGVLLPGLIAHYGIDKATAGLLFPAGTVGYLTAALGSGTLLERLGRRSLLMLGAGCLGGGALLVAFAPPFYVLLPIMLLIGFGAALLDAGLNAYIAGLARSTVLLNYLHAFYGGGALLGPLVASVVLATTGHWNLAYAVWAVCAVLLLFGFSRTYASAEPERSRAGTADSADAAGGAREDSSLLGEALRMPIVWLCALFLLAYVGGEVSLGSWAYTLLTESRRIPTLPASWMVSGYWMGLTVGRIALGRTAERLGARRVVMACIAGAAAGVLVVWLAPSGAVAAVGLWIVGFSFGPIFPSTIAAIGAVIAPRLQQTVIGFAASFGSMGAALFPWVAGNLAQRLGLWSLLPLVLGLTLAMLVLWRVLLGRLPGDALLGSGVEVAPEVAGKDVSEDELAAR